MAVSSDARAAADALRCRLCEQVSGQLTVTRAIRLLIVQVFDRERMPVSLCEGAVCSSCIAQPSLEASKVSNRWPFFLDRRNSVHTSRGGSCLWMPARALLTERCYTYSAFP